MLDSFWDMFALKMATVELHTGAAGAWYSKAIMMVVAYTVSTKSSSIQTHLILFLDAIKA